MGDNIFIFAHFRKMAVMRQIDPRQVTNEWEKTFLLVLFRCSFKEGFSGCVSPKIVLNHRKQVKRVFKIATFW
jgi:hypothetical protein